MTPVDMIGLLLAVGLVVYLLVALLYPEKFQ
ncbi:MAG: K(+)-transporting ATPase subunit F [Proteobacteria bacterium]|jgi:K+-transporting ATPase KdpF subunit|nr:K(+)-transporting ATPase subunit F [Pseudomonadota bacterium]MBK6451731.1 K(+)-transporting ATPase subunit F [Pseudomonadota bacterium]MBP7607914.1 K(+)-transporting ATPase subunit F [Steroidobacteraceae bacterium]MBP9128981.1 K(+)-transporting ATPase subunit F [Steroidobacteraceae bacterium]